MNHFEKQVELICKACADYYQRSLWEIYDYIDEPQVNRARKVAMYLARELTEQSFPKLAHSFKRKHHTTIMDAVDKMKKWINEYPAVRNQVFEIKEIVEAKDVYSMSLPAGFQKVM